MTREDVLNIMVRLGMIDDVATIKLADIIDISNLADDVVTNNDLSTISKFILALLVLVDEYDKAHQARKAKSNKALIQLEKEKLLEHIKQNLPPFEYNITDTSVDDRDQRLGD